MKKPYPMRIDAIQNPLNPKLVTIEDPTVGGGGTYENNPNEAPTTI
jgi:hypothetical protein